VKALLRVDKDKLNNLFKWVVQFEVALEDEGLADSMGLEQSDSKINWDFS
jgi:hypothetical protein